MSPTEQRHSALKIANERKTARAALRARLVSERGALADVMRDPPDLLLDMALIDVVRLAYRQRHSRALQRLGRLACRDNVNLMMPLGLASVRSREWVAEHASWYWVESSQGLQHRLRVRAVETA